MSNPAAAVPFRERLTCTVSDAVLASGIRRRKLFELIKEGRLDSVKLDRMRLIRVPSLLALIGETEPAE